MAQVVGYQSGQGSEDLGDGASQPTSSTAASGKSAGKTCSYSRKPNIECDGGIIGIVVFTALIVIAIIAAVLVSVYAPVLAVGLVIAIKVISSLVFLVAGLVLTSLLRAKCE